MTERYKQTRPDILSFDEPQWEGLEYMHAHLHEKDTKQFFDSGDARVVLEHDPNNYSQYSFTVFSADDLMVKVFEVDIFNSAGKAQLRAINKPKLSKATKEAIREWCDVYAMAGMDIPTGQEVIEFERIFKHYMEQLKQANSNGEA